MVFSTIITLAAKSVGVPAALLLAICSHESSNFTIDYNQLDGGSPSYGVCQVKEETARMLGFKGTTKDLMKPKINARYAAKYLKYQQDRYGNEDWCKLAAAYNAGTYVESRKVPGKPRNLKYIKLVQKKLSEDLQDKLSCDYGNLAEREK